MGKLSIYIADTNKDCMQAITDYFTQFEKEYFYKIIGFNCAEELSNALQAETPDILLVDYRILIDYDYEKLNCVIVLLEEGIIPAQFGEFSHINKYKPGREISTFVINVYSKKSNMSITYDKQGDTKIISVYSPIGGVGKTSVAAGLAKTYTLAGEKALYINLEDIPTTSLHFKGNNPEANFSEVLYEAIKNNPNIPSAVNLVQDFDKDGTGFIPPHENANELYELTPAQWKTFMEQLRKIGLYRAVIIDMSCSLDQKNLTVFSESDIVLVLTEATSVCDVKIKGFENYLNIMNTENFQYDKNNDKFFLIENTVHNRDAVSSNKQEFKLFNKSVFEHIPFDKYLALYGTVSLTYKFGEAMQAIRKKIKGAY